MAGGSAAQHRAPGAAPASAPLSGASVRFASSACACPSIASPTASSLFCRSGQERGKCVVGREGGVLHQRMLPDGNVSQTACLPASQPTVPPRT